MKIDLKQVKFRGQAIEIKDMLKNGDDLTITMQGSIISETAKDNQDGSVSLVYEFKPLSIEVEDCEQDTEIRDEVPVEDIPFLR